MKAIGIALLWPALSAAVELIPTGATFELRTPWKFHLGDNQRWAARDFDDSAWAVTESVHEYAGFVWYRQRVALPDVAGPLSFWVPQVLSGAEFFVDGELVGAHGDPARWWTHPWSLVKPLSVPERARRNGDILIAIRVKQIGSGPGLPRRLQLGSASTIARLAAADELEVWRSVIAGIFVSLVKFAAIAIAMLYWRGRPERREALWFALLCTGYIPSDLEAWRALTDGPQWWLLAIGPFRAAGLYGAWRLFGPLGPAPRWLVPLLTSFVIVLMIERFGAVRIGTGTPLAAALQIGILWRLLVSVRQRAPSEGRWLVWMFAPWFLFSLAFAVMLLNIFFISVSGRQMTLNAPGISLLTAPVRITLLQASELASICVIALCVSLRLLRERQTAAAELEAGGTVQRLLFDAPVLAHGWRAETVYWPARETGGDFYQMRQMPDGEVLLVVGDVSGKGMEAAMVASVAVGAFRTARAVSPSAVLENMNEALVGLGRRGFVTCCCAHLDRDGRMTIASAGHPAPYCDGQEVTVEMGLPLGVVAAVVFAESFARGERFTFISDGVVEAENPQRELFGFDRTREVSTKPAQEIAEAARQWGQNDDITVVTVRRPLT